VGVGLVAGALVLDAETEAPAVAVAVVVTRGLGRTEGVRLGVTLGVSDGVAVGVDAGDDSIGAGLPFGEELSSSLVKMAITPTSATTTLRPAIARVSRVFGPVGVADATDVPSPYAVEEPGPMIPNPTRNTSCRGRACRAERS
jgi:hypothetical protein